jgi:hypothetical protein
LVLPHLKIYTGTGKGMVPKVLDAIKNKRNFVENYLTKKTPGSLYQIDVLEYNNAKDEKFDFKIYQNPKNTFLF